MSDLEFSQSDQEQRVKDWWRDNRNSIFGGIALGLAGVWGWNYYQGAKVESSKAAASEYFSYMQANLSGGVSSDAALERLSSEYPNSAYTTFANMHSAASLLNEDVDKAIEYLESAVDAAPDAGLKILASIRLARVLLDAERIDSAEKVITALNSESVFSGYIAELKGDLLNKKGDRSGAKEAYERAISQLDPAGFEQNTIALLQRKIENLK